MLVFNFDLIFTVEQIIKFKFLPFLEELNCKGQIKPKAVCLLLRFSQKRNDQICFACRDLQKSKQNKFLGRLYGAPIYLQRPRIWKPCCIQMAPKYINMINMEGSVHFSRDHQLAQSLLRPILSCLPSSGGFLLSVL